MLLQAGLSWAKPRKSLADVRAIVEIQLVNFPTGKTLELTESTVFNSTESLQESCMPHLNFASRKCT